MMVDPETHPFYLAEKPNGSPLIRLTRGSLPCYADFAEVSINHVTDPNHRQRAVVRVWRYEWREIGEKMGWFE